MEGIKNSIEQLMIPIDEETEYIPIVFGGGRRGSEEDEHPRCTSHSSLRNTVLFPGVVIPITVGRDKSLRLVQEVYKKNKILGAVAQTGRLH